MPTRSIPWPRILAEGVAIVVSILLAFGIQAWWEGRQEINREQRMLGALVAEFEENAEVLEEAQQVYRRYYSEALRLLELIGRDPPAIDHVDFDAPGGFKIAQVDLSFYRLMLVAIDKNDIELVAAVVG